MKTGQITQTYKISRDTLRFYIRKGLLSPATQQGQYSWNQKDCTDLENILQLRELGLSIKAIQRIKEVHDTMCGTKEQWLENREVLQDEIAERRTQIQLLEQQITNLTGLVEQLNKLLAEKA
ncbi:MerR family transcriptional regulator [Streptococcus respiraculi]|uniref:MerR family transcriptional regulator n=1 Tax=Streptococcus respiraculi TaxID=2021971 RepID=UPI000E716786|nr:MerR family transcriptional regulator [Streptococcus respiraculi]